MFLFVRFLAFYVNIDNITNLSLQFLQYYDHGTHIEQY